MNTFRDLHVWQKAHQLVLRIYPLTQEFPSEERYGLTQQMRRSAISVAANITEGHQRNSKPEFLKFLNIAHSSLDELKYYLILTQNLGYLKEASQATICALAEEVGKMLNGLKVHIKQEVSHGKSTRTSA